MSKLQWSPSYCPKFKEVYENQLKKIQELPTNEPAKFLPVSQTAWSNNRQSNENNTSQKED